MSQAYIGEIRIFSGNFAPQGWYLCNGVTLPISGNETLFTLLGTTYGGNGTTNFALPDFRGRLPVGQGQGAGLTSRVVGQAFGTETVTLTSAQIPAHTHSWQVSTADGSSATPNGNVIANPVNPNFTGTGPSSKSYIEPSQVNPQTNILSGPTGMVTASNEGGQAHANEMPYLALNYIICNVGLYPTKS